MNKNLLLIFSAIIFSGCAFSFNIDVQSIPSRMDYVEKKAEKETTEKNTEKEKGMRPIELQEVNMDEECGKMGIGR